MVDTPPRPKTSQLTLTAFATAVSCARIHTRQLCWEWGLQKETAADIELLVSELTTNAVNISQPDHIVSSAPRIVPQIELRLSLEGKRFLIEVWDHDPRTPEVSMPLNPEEEESGRGLLLVSTLSKSWGYYHPNAPHVSGKVVWCELTVLPAVDRQTS